VQHAPRTPRQLGNLIRRARKKRGWNQSQLAERVGIRQATVSLIETGHPATRLDTLLALLAALDLELQLAERLKDSEASIEDLF
jgi:HTH-type transcriptional regulator / antitoxin HipB